MHNSSLNSYPFPLYISPISSEISTFMRLHLDLIQILFSLPNLLHIFHTLHTHAHLSTHIHIHIGTRNDLSPHTFHFILSLQVHLSLFSVLALQPLLFIPHALCLFLISTLARLNTTSPSCPSKIRLK